MSESNEVILSDSDTLEPSTALTSASVTTTSTGKRKRGPDSRHPIWDYYKGSADGKSKICLVPDCNVILMGHYSTNAESHLLKKHASNGHLIAEYKKKKRTYNDENKRRKESAGQEHTNQSKLTQFTTSKMATCSSNQLRRLALFIANTSVPFSIVSNPEFNDFCQSLSPNFGCPDVKKVLKEVQAIYSKLKLNIMSSLEIAGKITVCVDEWTKKGMNLSIIGTTAHFFNKRNHRLERILLGMRKIEHPRTAERIREMTFGLIKEWGVPEGKVWRIVTDNAKNMTKAFRTQASGSNEYATELSAADVISEEEFDEDADDEYLDDEESQATIEAAFQKERLLPCFIHTLVLAFKNPINASDSEVHKTIKDACQLVSHFSRSAKATEKLIELSGKKLLLPAKTRWNYHYHVLQRLLEQKEHVSVICECQCINNIQNWSKVKQLVQLLEPFAKWVDYLQGLNYPTIAHALPCLMELLAHLQDIKTQDVIFRTCKAIELEINVRFAAFLDPKHKNYNATYIVASAVHPMLALCLNESQLKSAREEIVTLMRNEPTSDAPQRLASGTQTVLEQGTSGSAISDMFPHLKKKIEEAKQQGITTVCLIEEEVNLYFKQLAGFSNMKCEIQFWVQRQMQFPVLSLLACDILAIPASSSAIESAFSMAGHATSARRHNLSVNLEQEVMIKINKHFL